MDELLVSCLPDSLNKDKEEEKVIRNKRNKFGFPNANMFDTR